MLKKIKTVYNVASTLLVVLAVALVVLLVGVRLVGLEPYAVLSGSMEPKYHVGSLIYVTDVDPATLKVGDPLTFRTGGTVVTHEIIEVIEGDGKTERAFVTQGLTNNVSDGQISASDIIGRPVFSLPLLGYVSVYVQTPVGMAVVAGILILMLAASFLFDLLTEEKKTAKASSAPVVSPEAPSDPEGERADKIENQNQEEKL
ncbi:MAG: signal peptidase I [Clostridia bacterium]|nr:signal peptidase I [Clostridia bacterium]